MLTAAVLLLPLLQALLLWLGSLRGLQPPPLLLALLLRLKASQQRWLLLWALCSLWLGSLQGRCEVRAAAAGPPSTWPLCGTRAPSCAGAAGALLGPRYHGSGEPCRGGE